MADAELTFVGKDFVDEDALARALRAVGVPLLAASSSTPSPRSRL
jgi:hypothetical protein